MIRLPAIVTALAALAACAPVPSPVPSEPRFPEIFEGQPIPAQQFSAPRAAPVRARAGQAVSTGTPLPQPETPPGEGLPPRGDANCVPGGSILQPACPETDGPAGLTGRPNREPAEA